MRRVLPIALLCLTACGSSAEIGLEARAIEDRSARSDYFPIEAGSRLVAVQVRLLDASGAPLPLSSAHFSLELDRGTPRPGHPLTAAFDDGCGGTLEPGAIASCWVGFEIPSSALPTRITYLSEGRRVSAPVPLGGDGGAPIPPGDAGAPEPTDEVDLLFVIDNSGSLTEEQASLTWELPRLVRRLGTGDLDEDGRADIAPLDLHTAVITTDMGTGGFTVPTCARPEFGDDGILRTQGRTDIAGCLAEYPSWLTFRPAAGGDPEQLGADLSCVATVGTGGCGFEQQLEAMLKALSPSAPNATVRDDYLPPVFHRNTAGHADGANAGFLRPDSVLAIVLMTDEEDCSARDLDVFNPESPTYGATDFNLRCFAHAEAALQPIERYVDGLLQLRRRARRLVYFPIAGIPADLEPPLGERPPWERLLSEDPARRDDRMEERVDPAMPSRLQPSCNVPGRGVAFPPVRIVRVAERLEGLGARVSVGSVCQESYGGSMDQLVRLVSEAARGE